MDIVFYSIPLLGLAFTSSGDYQDIITALTGSISVSTVSGVLVAGIGASIALVFFWWAARKVTQVIFSAFRSGKMRP